jgi:hypothetical protein
MKNYALLNNVEHKDLKIITERSEKYGDNITYAHAFPSEFRHIEAYYPIVFRKNPETTQFEIVALFGFVENENIFLKDGTWKDSYIPLAVAREPFLIGFQNTSDGNRNPVVHINIDSPRVSKTEGESIFLPQGGNSPYLEYVNSILMGIYEGIDQGKDFVNALLKFDLLESFIFNAELKDGSKYQMTGFYTINEENLANLNGEALSVLHGKGYLQLIYLAVASLANIGKLIRRKNDLL